MGIILDHHLRAVLEVRHADDQRQPGHDRREGAAVVLDHLLVWRADDPPEGEDEERHEDRQPDGADLHVPEMAGPGLGGAKANGALAVGQVTHRGGPFRE